MAIEKKNITIIDDDDQPQNYEITAHPATEATAILRIITKVTSGPLAALLAGDEKTDLNPETISKALSGVADVIAGEGDADLVKKLLKYSHRQVAGTAAVQNCAASFDTIYTQNYGELFAACYHALDCNFGKTLRKTKGRGIFQAALAKMAPKTQTPPEVSPTASSAS